MERGLIMLLHSLIIGIVIYFIMTFGLGQQADVAENSIWCFNIYDIIWSWLTDTNKQINLKGLKEALL